MKLKLVKSARKDLSIIANIYKTEFSKPPYNEKWNLKKAMNKMRFFKQNYDVYTIKFENQVVGFIVINPIFMCPGEVAFGEEMAIREDFQNKGIGTRVFGQIFKIYKKRGFRKFMGIAAKNGRVMNLYKRLNVLPSKKGILIEKRLN